jgi:hypothetical protein
MEGRSVQEIWVFSNTSDAPVTQKHRILRTTKWRHTKHEKVFYRYSYRQNPVFNFHLTILLPFGLN